MDVNPYLMQVPNWVVVFPAALMSLLCWRIGATYRFPRRTDARDAVLSVAGLAALAAAAGALVYRSCTVPCTGTEYLFILAFVLFVPSIACAFTASVLNSRSHIK